MSDLFQIPGTVSKVTAKANRGLRIQFDTQENLGDEQLATSMSLVDKYVWGCFMPDTQIDIAEIIDLPDLPVREDGQKSPSQRQRAVLFVYWKQQGAKGDFEVFYNKSINDYIDNVKEKLT